MGQTATVCQVGGPKTPRSVTTSDQSNPKRYALEVLTTSESSEGRMPLLKSCFENPSRTKRKDYLDKQSLESGNHAVLAWSLTHNEMQRIREDRLAAFHSELASILKFFKAEVLVDEAFNGVVLGNAIPGEDMSSADVVVRMGQLLCRWAWARPEAFGIHVGVHCGSINSLRTTAGGRHAYWGPGIAGAKKLCETSTQDDVVHLSGILKQSLNAFRHLRLTIVGSSGSGSFYLDPQTKAAAFDEVAGEVEEWVDPGGMPMGRTWSRSRSKNKLLGENLEEEEEQNNMSFETFTQMLATYQVDTSKFGKGFAKSLERFYKDVVKDRRSFLVVDGHKLHRIVELVRIFLRFRGDDGGIRELRIMSQGGAEGAERVRNQPLAMVLSEKTQGKWREAIQQCFTEKFDLQPSSQKVNFMIDEDAYSYSEEVGTESATIPGIPTTYKTHSVIVMVKDKLSKDVQRLGLPKGKDFSTTVQSAGSDEVVKRHWTWVPATDDREAELVTLLQQHGVDVSDWPWMAFAELYAEIYERAQSTLEVRHGELTRTISIIKVNIHADILCVNHELVVRAKKQKGSISNEKAKHLSMRTLPDQSWEDGMLEALHVKLGISGDEQREAMHVDHSTYRQTEEIAYSHTFPGLKTVYVVNEIVARIMNPNDTRWMFIGLPKGTDFNFSRRDVISKSGETDIVSTQWGWQLAEQGVAELSRLSHTDHVQKDNQEVPNLSRVEMPQPIKLKAASIAGELVVARLMKGLSTDWKLGRRAAERILDRSYGLKQYYADLLGAFPELRLYCVEQDDSNDQTGEAGGLTVAGRTTHDEYQRTIGALFAFFWLMRSNHDGKESFSLGMMENSSKDWIVKVWNAEDPIYVKRKAFLDGQHWDRLHMLLKSAGMFADEACTKPNTERVLAFLCLMTIHDVMKIDLLQPAIPLDKPAFGGYKPGDTIMDHDLALSYVLERFPSSLPSYTGLAKEGRDAVKFAHSKLDYNMGWLVQGEAPPGLLFRSFREVVVEGKAPATDIAFYFVHWFCDLAGAEPMPLQGCDKFVLKFPQKVLKSFLDSFQFVWTLSREKTETMVLEEYFAWRWTLEASLGPPPIGPGSIAMMRLILMAQGDSVEVVSSFQKLGKEDKDTLAFELNLSGRKDQFFGREEHRECVGPAVLIYYSPALMQKAGRKDARGAMQILAELFRQARELWPLTHDPQDVDRTVILRIDAIKDLEVPQLKNPEPGRGFVLKKNNEVDGMVRVVPIAEFQGIDWKVHTALIFGQSVVGAAGKNMKGNALAALGKRFSQYVFRGKAPLRTG